MRHVLICGVFAAGSSPYNMVPTSQGQQPGQMISPPPPGAQDSMYNMSLNGGDTYQSMGANVQSQVRTLFCFTEL